jgi:uncharacterized phage protein (TIGR02220 family)
MPRPLTNRYFRIWSPDMFGPDPDGFDMRKDLEPQERWCWDALRAMCAMSSLQPAVCKSPLLGYTDNDFAETIAVQPFVWKGCKQKLILAGKIDVDSQNVIVIRNWDRYAAKYFRGHAYKDGLLRGLTADEELRLRGIEKEKHVLFAKVIKHLNETAGRHHKTSCARSFSRVSARFDEGYRWEDFKHVIEVKAQQWVGNPKMEPCLRPETLFAEEKFDAYRQEHLVVRKGPIGGSGSLTIIPEERAKYEEEAKAEYALRKVESMERAGAKTEEDWDYMLFKEQAPTFEDFFKIFLKKKRESGEWSL